ncbi:MAG: hypothetical protein ACLPX5_06550 [Dissulfurispiraceae bacterium]
MLTTTSFIGFNRKINGNSMTLKRKNIVRLLFIAVFVGYVLSPLMFPRTGNAYAGILSLDSKTACSSKGLHIIFEKVICFNFIHKDSKEDRSGSTIIVRKSRTIIPEDKIAKLTLLNNLSVAEQSHLIIVSASPSPSEFMSDGTPSNGFYFLSSGLSPPAA